MFTLSLCLALSVAPVPKSGENYEGHIALLLVRPKPTIVVLKPSGEELKRIAIKEVDGNYRAIRQSRDAKFVIISVNDGDKNKHYRISLEGDKNEAKLIHESEDEIGTWAITKSGTHAYVSEYDSKNAKANDEFTPFVSWKIELATGKKEKIDVPPNHFISDICQDDEDILMTDYYPNDNPDDPRSALYSLSKKKNVFFSDPDFGGVCLSANGKSILLKNPRLENKKVTSSLQLFSLETKKTVEVPKAEKMSTQDCFSLGVDSKRVVYVTEYERKNLVYVATMEKKEPSLIYTSKEGEIIVDCDWR
jgi:hypothetical protein